MPSLGMGDAHYPLDVATIDAQVTRTAPGNYALGHLNSVGQFVVEYVGRSDSDVASRLKQHAGTGYARFKFGYATSPKAGFERECTNYHDFGGPQGTLANKYHPQRPANTDWKCPRCSIFG